MTDTDFEHKLDELDRLLNDVEVPVEPAEVWSLLAEISHHDIDAQRTGTRTAE
jgi:ribosomal protein L12E/L44/L45/RPP1/RPP2